MRILLFFIAVIFPFLRPLFKFFRALLIGSGTTEQAKAAQFMINTARKVIELRKQTGMSQVYYYCWLWHWVCCGINPGQRLLWCWGWWVAGAKNVKSVIACIKSKETAFIVIAQNYQKRIQSFFYRSTECLRIHCMNVILITQLMAFGYTMKTPKLPFWENNVKNNIDFTCIVQLHFQSLSNFSC